MLSDAPRDFSQVHINALPEGVSVTESRVTENAALFRLKKTGASHEIDLLSQFQLVRTGIVLNGEELPRQKGATFHSTEVSISGIRKSAIDAHPPYQGISGDAFGEWTLSLPDTPRLRLEFDVGLQDGSENSDGVTFIVAVQGKEIFRRHYNEQRWEAYQSRFDTLSEPASYTPIYHDTGSRWKWRVGLGGVGTPRNCV